ncbi:MAG: hypothetical protein WC869_00515 [Phycisphaerae bacterium]|jgi:hypothetical protein
MATADGLAPPYDQFPWLHDYLVDPVLIKTEIRNDYIGQFTAYVYSDNHVETDPPGRPLFKEDAQRQLLGQKAVANAPAFLKIARGAESQPDRPALQADGRHASNTRVMAPAFADSIAGLSAVTATFTSSKTYRESLVSQVDLGGVVVGDRAGTRPEFGGEIQIDELELNQPTGLR